MCGPQRLQACALASVRGRCARKRGAQACRRKPRPGREFRSIPTRAPRAGRLRAEEMAGRPGPSDAERAGATERAEKAGGSAGVSAGAAVGGRVEAGGTGSALPSEGRAAGRPPPGRLSPGGEAPPEAPVVARLSRWPRGPRRVLRRPRPTGSAQRPAGFSPDAPGSGDGGPGWARPLNETPPWPGLH